MTFLAQYISNKNLLLHGWAKCYRRPTQYSDHPSRTEYHLLDASPAYRTPLLDRSTVNPYSHCDPQSRVFVLNQYQSHENASYPSATIRHQICIHYHHALWSAKSWYRKMEKSILHSSTPFRSSSIISLRFGSNVE